MSLLAPWSSPPRRSSSRPLPFSVRVRITVARHRRPVVAALVALAVAAGLQSLRPAGPGTTGVVVTSRDLPAGHRLTSEDLAVRPWPAGALPAGLLPQPAGRVLAAPVRRGEPVTDVRVRATGPGHGLGSRPPAGWVAVTVRLFDPASTLSVAAGDRVSVIAGAPSDPLAGAASGAGSGTGPARVLVDDALVLATPAAGEAPPPAPAGASGSTGGGGLLGAFSGGSAPGSTPSGSGLPAGVLLLGVPADAALDLAAAGGVRALTVARRLPPDG